MGVHISPEHTTRRSVFHEDRIGRGIQGAAGAPQAEHPRAAQPHALDDLDAAVSGAQFDTTWQAIDGFLGCKIDATGEVLAGVAVAVEEAHVQVEGFVHGGDARTEEAQQARQKKEGPARQPGKGGAGYQQRKQLRSSLGRLESRCRKIDGQMKKFEGELQEIHREYEENPLEYSPLKQGREKELQIEMAELELQWLDIQAEIEKIREELG